MRNAFLALVPICLFIAGCQPKDVDEANYKYSVATWQGTHIYSNRFEGAIRKSRRIVTEANRLSGLPGAQIAVAVNGEIVWSENFGFSNFEEGRPVRHNTIFRTASVSKLFTASAVAKLLEEGKLNLDTPVNHYLPELPAHYEGITIRHLVSHQSGIRHYFGADQSAKDEHYEDVNDALNLFVDAPLLFPPGQNCEYSSYGWVLLSAVIQRVSKKPFLQYMQDDVWKAMNLKNTFAQIPASRESDLTKFYIKNAPQESWKQASYQDLSFNWGAAGFTSNANDLVTFGNALLNGKFLKKETIDLMFAPQVTNKGDTTGFGIGVTLYHNRKEKIVGHGGLMPTARSYVLLFPESNVVIAFTANSAMTNFSDENLVEIVHNFINENADQDYFRFNHQLNQAWTGLWRIEMENANKEYDEAYLHLYEDKSELKGAFLSANVAPKHVEITGLKSDSINCLVMFPSHTATVKMNINNDVLSGDSHFNKPLVYELKKLLTSDDELSELFRHKGIRNGKKLK